MINYRIIDPNPDKEYNYEFEVAKKVSPTTFEVVAHFTNGFEAEKFAVAHGYEILHNVRIQGKRKK